MKLTVIAVGKRHDSYVLMGIEEFTKRLSGQLTIEWKYIAYAGREASVSRKSETASILEKIPENAYVILLDERGTLVDSPTLSELLAKQLAGVRPVVIVIGGAYGVDNRLFLRANFTWSLSPLVFPHQLVRLLLVEQLYRARTITRGEPYHHA